MTEHDQPARSDSTLGWLADIERITLDNTNFRTDRTHRHARSTHPHVSRPR